MIIEFNKIQMFNYLKYEKNQNFEMKEKNMNFQNNNKIF